VLNGPQKETREGKGKERGESEITQDTREIVFVLVCFCPCLSVCWLASQDNFGISFERIFGRNWC